MKVSLQHGVMLKAFLLQCALSDWGKAEGAGLINAMRGGYIHLSGGKPNDLPI